MRIGKYIYATLMADDDLTALIADRLYPVFLPMNADDASMEPSVVYMVSNAPHGQSKVDSGTHDSATVTFHLWADVSQGQSAYAALEEIDAAIRTALDYVEGTAEGVTVESCRYLGTVDGRDEANLHFLKTATYSVVHRK